MAEKEFVDGLIAKKPRDGAPDFVKCGISMKRAELIAWLSNRNDDWINLDVKESGNSGKWYAEVDNWKPNQGGQSSSQPAQSASQSAQPESVQDDFDDDFPF